MGSRAAGDGARADFTSGEERRGSGLGETDRARARPQEVGMGRRRTVGVRQSLGQGGRRGFEQRRVRSELAQRAAGVAAAWLAIARCRRRPVVALRAEDGGGAEGRLELRGDDRKVVALLRMMIGQGDELGEDRKGGEQRDEARQRPRWPRATPFRFSFARFRHSLSSGRGRDHAHATN